MPQSILDRIGLSTGTDKASGGHNYLDFYEDNLNFFQNETFTMLEIGGLNGASLAMWSKYFPNARVVCVDINPAVKQFEAGQISVEIGNSADPQFLESVVKKHGPFRLILDDGSHRWDHMRVAFRALYPGLEAGGIYIVEDLHTNYEGRFAGDDDVPFINSLYQMVDLLHARGDQRRTLIQRASAGLVAASNETRSINFGRRCCIITKKASPAQDLE